MMRVRGGCALLCAVLFAFTGSAYAQGMGSIFGKVTDTSGAVMPGVTVTVTGSGLQQPRVAHTTETGAYQFPNIPIGTYTVTFELQGFKKATRANVQVVAGFNAGIDQALEIGAMTEEMTVSGAAPVVDTKRTTTGAVFDATILNNIPTARDPWQIINMTPGVVAGLNVGGSSSGQQVGLSSRGTGANVQWNLEGGSITDLSSNSSPSYFNFDSFEQIQVVNGGGDVSVQSSGLSINLITKSGSNTFKGSTVGTFENDKMQFRNVDEGLFSRGAGGFISGSPINRITNASIEYGGPIVRNRVWFWGSADHQDINAGVLNFFDVSKGANCAAYADAQRLGQNLGIAYEDLDAVQKCLKNDKTVIKNLGAKINFQINSAHKVQYLFQSDDKIRNTRGASSTTALEAATRQFSDSPWGLPLPTHSLTHTWVVTDKLVFNNMYTYVNGGFFLDYQDYDVCGQSRYNGSGDANSYLAGDRANSNCLWNQQQLMVRTTEFRSRSILGSYQTVRHSHELKSDGTYFMSNKLGGDHSLKFGVGYRRNPILSFSHYSGGGRAWLQCNGNSRANCSDDRITPGTAGPGMVPYRAELYRDQLRNNNWWSYNGYIQDSFNRGKWRVNAGLRYDYQHSEYLGGCVPANAIRPDLLPAQCEEATQSGVNPNTGQVEKIQPFSNWSPRAAVTYDLFGNGKTALKVVGSVYYQTRITLADSLGALATTTRLTFGSNNSNGTCSSAAGSCWTDANRDGIIQANELTGVPSVPAAISSRFDPATGILTPAGNIVDEDTKLRRTREVVAGIQHELVSNLAIGVDYIFRKYDLGTQTFTIGYEPGSAGFPLSSLYTGPVAFTDPVSGNTANYYVICPTCVRPSGVGNITTTSVQYDIYHGVDLTLNKRYSNRWQGSVAVTLQTNPAFHPLGSFVNPTGEEHLDERSTIQRYVVKANGAYELPWGIMLAGNFIMNQGGTRTLVIDGPGSVPNSGGLLPSGARATNLRYDTLEFGPRDQFRFDAVRLLDLGVQRSFRLGVGERYRLKLMFDVFNVLNEATILGYSTDNASREAFNQINNIVPPRVMRVGAVFNF